MNDVRWEGFTHEEIYARVQAGPGRAASADAETAWATVARTIRDVDAQLTRAAEQIGIGWQGAAAENVRGGMTVMSNWALDAANDAELTRNGITAQADAAAHVRAAMPPPRAAQWTEAVGGASTDAGLVLGVPNIGVLEDRSAGDRAVAVELMNRYTSDSSTNTRMMDYWTPPPSVVVETVAPSPVDPTGAAAGLVAPAAVVPHGGAAGAGTAGRGSASGRGPSPAPSERIEPGAVIAPGGAGDTAAVERTGSAPIPDGSGAAGRSGTPRVAPGVPGPGTGRSSGSDLPSTRLPGDVRPVVPGPPPRPGPLPGGDGTLPGGSTSGVERSPVPDRGSVVAPAPRATPGFPDGTPPRSPFALPPEPPPGVLGAPTGPAPGVGGPAEGVPAARSSVEPGVAERLAGAGRGGTVNGAGFLPLGGMPISSTDQEHRRPDYLVEDADAFADDRWFTPAVLGADDTDGC